MQAGKGQKRQLAFKLALDPFALCVLDAVPFVHRDHHGTPLLQDITGEAHVLFADLLTRVQHQHHHVGFLDRLQGLDDGILLQHIGNAAALTHARRVDKDVVFVLAL